jgi:hypothetical protein
VHGNLKKVTLSAVREEIFGPVVAAAPFNAENDILPTANNTNYGLVPACSPGTSPSYVPGVKLPTAR